MKIKYYIAILLFSLLTLLLITSTARAGCFLTVRHAGADIPQGTIVTATISPTPLTVRMPKDIAQGSELYRITARQSKYSYYRPNCNNSMNPLNYYTLGKFTSTAPIVSTFTSSLGTVYQTDVTGVGMVILTGSTNKKLGVKTYFPTPAAPYCETVYPVKGCATFARDADITFVLIKTGDITATSLNLATLPTVESVTGGDNSPGSDITIFRASLTGVINFTQPTCALAEKSKTVQLGSHTASDFTATTPHTPWVNASIGLISCNYGGTQGYAYNVMGYSNSSTISEVAAPITSSALWSLTLTPGTSVINDASGIMAIDSSKPNPATGVGIQLATSNTASPDFVKFSQPITGTLVSGVNQTMTLPLYARYIKTGSTVTGGKADGIVTYTVEYK